MADVATMVVLEVGAHVSPQTAIGSELPQTSRTLIVLLVEMVLMHVSDQADLLHQQTPADVALEYEVVGVVFAFDVALQFLVVAVGPGFLQRTEVAGQTSLFDWCFDFAKEFVLLDLLLFQFDAAVMGGKFGFKTD